MKNKKYVFKNKEEEAKYYDNLDYTEYVKDLKRVKLVFPNLKPTKKPITIRLPEYLIQTIKAEASTKDVPYQTLIRDVLKEKFTHKH